MNLLIRIVLTIIILAISYYALVRIWTKEIDIQGWLKKPSETIPVKEQPISIVPNELKLSTSEWKTTQIFEIKNHSGSETLYSVWIKITPKTRAVDFSTLELLSETDKPFVSANVHDVNVNYELVKIIADDPSKKQCLYLLIYRINKLESKYFKIKPNVLIPDIGGPVTLSLKAMGYSSKPAPMASKEGAAAMQFTPPENMTVRSISLLLKKDM